MKKNSLLAALITAAVLAIVPAAAQAHVTIQPGSASADSYTRIDLRVPNESDSASTKSVKVKFPSGIYYTGYEPIPGWKVSVKSRKLATPIKMEDDTLTTETEEVSITATGDGIEPGQFQDFGLSISTPNKPGTALKFPAVQTYSDGEVARWIGSESSEQPAPTLELTAAEAEGHHGGEADDAEASDSDSSSTIAWIALALGALGLIAGGSALVLSRRRAALAARPG
jgi:uncharacterized protein